ncbi:putative nuclease HARBI1 [Prorops nasuta]|uniref:putative nuclease HARBI1 n=1 Tax=Prorops nasuta TaxID=863751 RepID=UPI0034CD4A07
MDILDRIENLAEDWLDEDDHNFQIISARRPRVIRIRNNWLQMLNNFDFKNRFMLNKEEFNMVLNKIECNIINRTNRNNFIPPVIQLLVTLRFLATGSFVIAIADFIGISVSSALRIIHKVSIAITELHSEFIKFPTNNNDIRQCQIGNFKLAGFIKVIGAVDCFHVKIQSYGGENSELFRNRKGYFSINVQVIVNSKLQILDLVARWPESAHDSTIFDNSRIKARFENLEFGDGILLGDSGYPSLPYLLTPLQNPQTSSEVLYNEAHIRTRCMVERCFGILQRKFAVLSLGSRFKTPKRTLPLITACAILHNISRLSNPLRVISITICTSLLVI